MKKPVVIIFSLIVNLMIIHLSFGQGATISGKVTTLEGEALSFASVALKGTTLGSSTDKEGAYSITNIPAGEYELWVSFIGYKTIKQTIIFNNGQDIERSFVLEEDANLLEEIVVSVPGGRLQEDLVVNVDKRELDELYISSNNTLAESITNLTGVVQNTTGNSIGKPVIRGLTSNRVVTYAQGTRIENQQWGAEHGLGVSSNGVKSVEVIKGPASLLYGSDAIGGVLYFVDENFTNRPVEGVFETGYFNNSRTTQNRIGLKTGWGSIRLNTFLGFNSAGDYDAPVSNNGQGSRVFNTRFNETNGKVALGFVDSRLSTKLTYTYLNNMFGIPSETPFTGDFTRDFELPFQDVTQHNLAWESNFDVRDTQVDLILGYSVNDRQEFNETEDAPDLHLNLGVFSYNLKFSELVKTNQFDLTVGAQGLFQVNRNRGTVFLIPDGESLENGIYSLLNLRASDRLSFQSGLRFDAKTIRANSVVIDGVTNFADFDETYNSLNYSVGAKYALNNTTFRFNIASGFRAPNTSELLSNGEHGGVGRIEVGDQNLTSEAATQFDFAINYQNSGFEFLVNPFLNVINNYIFITPTGQTGERNLPIFAYLQENATLYGGEVSVSYRPSAYPKLLLQTSAALTFGEDSDGNPLPLIPPVNFNTRATYNFGWGSVFKLESGFIQVVNFLEQNRVGQFELENDDYILLNAGVSASFRQFQFSVTAKNIFDTSYVDHLSRLKTIFENNPIPNPGRDVTFNVRYNF